MQEVQHAVDRRRSAARPTRCSTSSAAAAAATAASPTRDEPAPAALARNRGTVPAGRRARRHRGPPAPGRAVDRPASSRAAGRTVRLFRSRAKYFEPAGAVSWDVAMTATPPDWRVRRQARRRAQRVGDLRHRARVVVRVDGDHAGRVRRRRDGGAGPVRRPTSTCPGGVTHGHLPENGNHGGALRRPARPARRCSPAAAARDGTRRDQRLRLRPGRPQRDRRARRARRRSRRGQRADVRQPRRAATTICHTITACRAPCNRTTGIAYPLADGPVDFDSGELGFGPRGLHRGGATATRGRRRTTLRAGHLHVLLPRPPVHARRVPRRGR